MSLRAWFQLNGDLSNKGISNAIATNDGATIDNNGKIGKCYAFNNTRIIIDSMDLQNIFTSSSQPFSFATWIYLNSDETDRVIIFGNYNANPFINWELLGNGTHRLCAGGTSNFTTKTNSTVVPKTTWTHIAVTYDGTITTFYQNGVSIGTASGANTITTKVASSRFYLGSDTRNDATRLKGKLCDFRCYDHCLSAAEVREIAQGLVLHYKLDSSSEEKITTVPSTNAYSYPTFNTSTASGGWNHWGPSGHSGSYGQNTDKKYIYNKNNTYSHWITEDAGTGKYYLLYQSPAFEGGYRSLQAIIKEENGLPITESICYPDWNARNGGVPNYKWTTIKSLGDGFYYCCCEGVSQDGSNDLIGIIVQPGYKIYVSECYLENNTEICSPIFTYSSNIIQDSSGYNHNGQIISDINISTDTIRYNTSALFDGVDDCIIVPYNTICPENIFTINLWFKKDALGSKNYETLFGGPSGFEMDTRAGSSTALSLYMASTRGSNAATGLQLNTWYMVTMVRDGINERYYINGELKKEIEAKAMPNGTYRIGAWASNTGQNYYGNISDFRIYCTPLLDTDIKQLYNVGMKVDKGQNIHAFEFNEQNENLFSSIPWTTSYGTHSTTNNLFTNFNSNGEPQFTANSTSAGSDYIIITPGIYEYDYTISVNTGNQFYIGFERYDADKTSRSNAATVYTYSTKPTANIVKQRYKGTVNLSTDGVNPIKYIALRILNGWSGTTSGVVGQATIHNFSLKLQSTTIDPSLNKQGCLLGGEYKEYSKASLYKDHIIEANQIIEK